MSTPILYKGDVQVGVWKYLAEINLPAVFGCVSNQTGIPILNGGFPVIDGAVAACVFTPPDEGNVYLGINFVLGNSQLS